MGHSGAGKHISGVFGGGPALRKIIGRFGYVKTTKGTSGALLKISMIDNQLARLLVTPVGRDLVINCVGKTQWSANQGSLVCSNREYFPTPGMQKLGGQDNNQSR